MSTRCCSSERASSKRPTPSSRPSTSRSRTTCAPRFRRFSVFRRLSSRGTATELEPEAVRYLDLIVESTRGMGELIDDLLGSRRPTERRSSSSRWISQRSPTSAIGELEPQLEGRKLEVVLRAPSGRSRRPDPAQARAGEPPRQRDQVHARGEEEARVEIDSFQRERRAGHVRARQRRRLRHGACRTGSSASSSACTAATSSREPGSGWRWSNASSSATAAGSGRNRPRGKGATFYFTLEPAGVARSAVRAYAEPASRSGRQTESTRSVARITARRGSAGRKAR